MEIHQEDCCLSNVNSKIQIKESPERLQRSVEQNNFLFNKMFKINKRFGSQKEKYIIHQGEEQVKTTLKHMETTVRI